MLVVGIIVHVLSPIVANETFLTFTDYLGNQCSIGLIAN